MRNPRRGRRVHARLIVELYARSIVQAAGGSYFAESGGLYFNFWLMLYCYVELLLFDPGPRYGAGSVYTVMVDG